MDEILASIRRIIESSDEKPGRFTAAAQDRAAAARDGADRSTAFPLPAPAARVVPFSDRASVAPEMPAAIEPDDADERWVPMTEPANSAGEPPAAAHLEPVGSPSALAEPTHLENVLESSAEAIEPVMASDRWARELDDAESWSVLGDGETSGRPMPDLGAAFSDVDDSEVEPSDAVIEAQPADILVGPVADESTETDDDFLVDFDEADFVEALDRNTAAANTARDEWADVSATPGVLHAEPSQPSTDEPSVPQSASDAKTFVGSGVPAFLGARAALSAAGAEPSAAPAPSMMQQTSALMSEQAGIQVAAAFDDLTRAIRDGQMTSMEDMAREMVRPMLQEWLDDNLPRLVERLVREEIERVSRGGRR